MAALAVVGATLLSVVLMLTTALAPPGMPSIRRRASPPRAVPGVAAVADAVPQHHRRVSLVLGAVFSAYVFMPKRRVLDYSLDPNQPGDQFLFNLLIAPVAIAVNLVVSLPGAVRALVTGRIHSRVPATILIAIGAFPALTRHPPPLRLDRAVPAREVPGVVFLFVGFLVSIEVFREIRVPFTGIRLVTGRREHPDALRGERRGPRTPSRARRRSARYRGPIRDHATLRGTLLALVAASLFATLGPLSRYAAEAGIGAIAFVAWRAGIGALALAVPIAVTGGSSGLAGRAARARPPRAPLAGRRGVMGFTLNVSIFLAFGRLTIAPRPDALLHVPGDGGRGRDPHRPGAADAAAGQRAGDRLGWRRSRPDRRSRRIGRPRDRSARRAARARSRGAARRCS